MSIIELKEDIEVAVYSGDTRTLIFNTALTAPKTTRAAQGVGIISLKKNYTLVKAVPLDKTSIKNVSRYRVKKIPAAGALLQEEDSEEQQTTMF